MRVAILSVTERGRKLYIYIERMIDKDPTIINVDTFHKNIKDNIDIIFNSNNDIIYDAIIRIMASGILIRNITGKIQDKTIDPAIIHR